MVRNLDSRVELLIPVEDLASKKRLIRILEAIFKDNTNAFLIQPDGSSKRIQPQKGEKPFRLQEHFYRQAVKSAKNYARRRTTTFQPYRSPED